MNKQEKLIERRRKNVPRGLFHISKHAIAKGHGARIIDVNGKELIDFASGVGVLNTGHTPEKVVRAVQQQAESYLHSCFNLMLYEPYITLAERLNEIIPAAGSRKTFFVNSGAEAVEHAVKLARHFTGKADIITFHYAYHGRTLLTTTMTGRVRSYRTGFGPGVPGVHRAPYPYCYRCPSDARPTSCNLECFRSFRDLFIHTVPLKDVAAVVMEPVLGEGGVIVPPGSYIREMSSFCRENRIVLIMDEIQSGIGRTGYWTASEYFGIQPDIILTAKALASGLPLGSVTGSAEILDSPPPGGIGGTFCGNPLCCAAALATLEMIEEMDLLRNAGKIGDRLLKTFTNWADELEIIGDVRGLGAWVALELVTDRSNKEPASKIASNVIKTCHGKGLMVLLAGPYSNVLRIMPPW